MANYNAKPINGAILLSCGRSPLRVATPGEVPKRFAKSMRVLAREAPNLRQCYFGVSLRAHLAISELLLSQRRNTAAAAATAAMRKFVRERMTLRARKGWKRLWSLHT
jgi:hypothetical protein